MHKYPHFAVPEPRIGFLQEALRWWDHWLKGKDTGVDEDPDYTAYLMDGVRPKLGMRSVLVIGLPQKAGRMNLAMIIGICSPEAFLQGRRPI